MFWEKLPIYPVGRKKNIYRKEVKRDAIGSEEGRSGR